MACTRVWASYCRRLPTLAAAVALLSGAQAAQSLRWTDLPATVQRRLTILGVHEASFPAFLTDHASRTAERVRESDWDALIYYALQSTSFTMQPAIEPALDAKAFFEGLGEADRVALSGRGRRVARSPTRRDAAAFHRLWPPRCNNQRREGGSPTFAMSFATSPRVAQRSSRG